MFTKGNKYGGKREGAGRKTIKQEIEEAKELITQEALIDLANSKVYKQLKKIDENNELEGFIKTKEMALPVTLKGITEKKISDVNVHLPKRLNDVLPDFSDKENLES